MNLSSAIRARNSRPPVRRAARRILCGAAFVLGIAGVIALSSVSHAAPSGWGSDTEKRRVISDQNGNVAIHDGERVRVTLEMGDVHVHTQTSAVAVQYRLRIEAPASSNWNSVSVPRFQLTARSGADGAVIVGHSARGVSSDRFWVTLDIDVPRGSPLDLSTQGGNIDVGDIDARLVCETAGGKIRVGRAGSSARLQTAGGDVSIQDVSGDLAASTGGGNILAGAVRGTATLRSGGGHIRVARVDGEARIDTGGGNIFLEKAGANLAASTGGGRIVVGEAGGELSARTGGGGIRVWHVSGPARIQSGAGSIFLAGVSSPVRASTASGGITARFVPVVASGAPAPPAIPRLPGGPPAAVAPEAPRTPRAMAATFGDFECNGGDIVVFLPKDVSLTLDAAIEGGDNYRMVVDPSFTLVLKADDFSAGRAFRAEGVLGQGGPLLRLRAVSGNILLRPVDGAEALVVPMPPAIPALPPRPAPAPLPPDQAMDATLEALNASIDQMQSQLETRQAAFESYASAQELKAMDMVRRPRKSSDGRTWTSAGNAASSNIDYNWSADQLSQLEGLREQFSIWFSDSVIVSAAQLRPRLIRRVDPEYPERARQKGIEGDVRLRVAIARDGSIEDVKALSGDPLLAEAATAAVKQWKYRPILLDGKPVPALTVLTITFHRP